MDTRPAREEIPLKQINEFSWEIEKTGKMNVPAIVYTSEKLLTRMRSDRTLMQLRNVAMLPGILMHAVAMPDAHEGYGFPIGGVAAFDLETGIISPGGVGYDINCGVRLIRTNWTFDEIKDKRNELLDELFKKIPCGVGRDTTMKLSREDLKDLLTKGAKWSLEKGFATARDLECTEENGYMAAADTSCVSTKALQRGAAQIGTLGSGNHFLEMQKVDKIFNKEAAKKFGIDKEGQVLIMIHCGSRGFGHQVASDYIRLMEENFGHEHLPDRELACAPIKSEVGQKYYKAMCCAINFAFANRQMITHNTREAFKKVLGTSEGMDLIYDVCHNIAKYEEHEINGKMQTVCVHRKGATRSFGKNRKEIPDFYRDVGQPVLIPGSMGTASYVLIGTSTAEQVSFGSTAHGAGRVMSRTEATRTWRGEEIRDTLATQDIILKAASWRGVAEEAAQAYKDIDEVAKVSHGIGIGGMVARLVPIAVMKG